MPTLLALISDIFFSIQVQDAAHRAEWTAVLVETPDQVPGQPMMAGGDAAPSSSQNSRIGHSLVAYAVDLRLSLIVIELASLALPWEAWIIALKTSPATRRIPLLGFAPHVNTELRERGRAAGCDAVITQGQLAAQFPKLLQQYAQQVDPEAALRVTMGELAPQARHGIQLFNRGEYFEAHEELELAWKAERGPIRDLYQGILQVGVAYLHITRFNYNGAIKMFLRARQWLDPLPDICRGVDVASLRQDSARARSALEVLGPDHVADFDQGLLKPVRLDDIAFSKTGPTDEGR